MESLIDKQYTDTVSFKEDLQALVEHEMFPTIAHYIFPDTPLEEVRQQLLATENLRQFQYTFMYRACQWVVKNSMTDFTYSGTEYLDGSPRLFISNHRDIVLDAMMLQYILVEQGLETTHVVIGANLFEIPAMSLLARLNKMYGIGRGGNQREYYRCLMTMSQHRRHWVTELGESAWIAQRNGRTKDGIDHTDPALIKMIAATGSDPVHALADMNIVPLSISYQWEPCAPLKARELCLRSRGPYQKAPGEDSQSIVSGITEYKGDVHLAVCPPLTLSELQSTQGHPDQVAALVDSRINQAYKMFDTNQMAARLLQSDTIADFPQAEQFNHYIEQACLRYPLGPEYRQTLLSIYANPLKNVLPC